MKRILIAGLLGAVVYYIWGMMAWMVFHLHDSTLSHFPNEQAMTAALREQNLETGVYAAPGFETEAEWDSFVERHRSGPVYSIFYSKEGSEPMGPTVMAGGFVIDLLAAALAACLLSSAASGCCNSYAARVGFVAGLGIFVGLVGHASYWNWMNFPLDYTIMFIVDVTIGWTLTGLVIAAIVKPPPADAWNQKQADS